MKRKAIILTLLVCIGIRMLAIIANPTPFYYTLEDGTTVLVQQHGDEYNAYMTDMQGNVVAGHKPTAQESEQIHLRRVQNQKMVGGNFPLTGSPKSVVILIQFKDKHFVSSSARQDFYNLQNEVGYSQNGATGSCRDYFIANSSGVFMPQFDVWGPYTASHEMSYYCDGNKHSAREKDLFVEACQLALEDGVDFSQYDTDGNGVIDNVFFYYAGNSQAEGNPGTIWPHASDLSNKQLFFNGKLLASYACGSECRGRGNTMCAIGTFCHEFGHVLGLPDWYDTEYNHYAVGEWSVMDGGSYNNNSCTPPSYNAYERFYLGWLTPIQLETPNIYYLSPLTESNTAYLIAADRHNLSSRNPNPIEFFLLENRQLTGWDAPYLPGTGMLVWHIDFSASAWSNNTPNNGNPLRMHLEEADGSRGKSSATDPYPGIKNITTFTPCLHNGQVLNEQPLLDITDMNGVIEFTYIRRGETRIAILPSQIALTTGIDEQGTFYDWKAEQVELQGHDIATTERFQINTPAGSNFYVTQHPDAVQKASDLHWSHSITLNESADENGMLNATFYICYRPKAMNCEAIADIMTIRSDSNLLSVPITGTAPRPVLITTPEPDRESNITPFAFTASWPAVTDAEAYYLTLYRIEDGQSELVQSFEYFDDPISVTQEGWQSTFYETTTASKKDGQKALKMAHSGDKVITEKYPSVVSKVSYWVSTFSTEADTVGTLVLEATADGIHWALINENTVLANTKNKTYSFEVSPDSLYTQFALSFIHQGGEGLALDVFTATCVQKLHYIYKGEDATILSTGTDKYQFTCTGLSPNQDYYYQLRCSDFGKGCQENLSSAHAPRLVHTLSALETDTAIAIGVQPTEEGYDYYAYLKSMEQGSHIAIYSTAGHLIYSVDLAPGQTSLLLPDEYFVHGQVYIVKYSPSERLHRKDLWKKFIYLSPEYPLPTKD